MKRDYLNNPPTNTAGEGWTHAIKRHAVRQGNTREQCDQAIERARKLVAGGDSTARAISIVCGTLTAWSRIRGDDATFNARRAAFRGKATYWVRPA